MLPISVVIATLGGPELEKTLANLNKSPSHSPNEILICIPGNLEHKVSKLTKYQNLKILRTKECGQVLQRAHGLGQATQEYVLQLDDDVSFEENALYKLYQELEKLGVNNCISPAFMPINSNICNRSTYSLLRDIMLPVICGAALGFKKQGTIAPSGIGYGVDPKCNTNIYPMKVQWLPGGFILCRRGDLVLENYYPWPGKAYSEDLIHSVLWGKKYVQLWVTNTTVANVIISKESYDLKEVYARFRAHLYVARLIKCNGARTYIWLLIYVLKNFSKIVKNNFKK